MVTKVILFCFNCLYLDSDLNFGSIKMIVYAKNWIVCGEDL